MRKIIVLLFIVCLSCVAHAAQIEYGNASFYGAAFNGRPTASGELYSQNKLTAAHKTLPLGTVIKVTNAHNKKSVFVKVNDRGPYVKGRVLDLSTKAAELLGYRQKGTAYVKIEVIEPDDVPNDLMTASTNIDVATQNGINTTTQSDTTVADDNHNIPTGKTIPAKINDDTKTKKDIPVPQPISEAKDANSNGITNRNPYLIITRLDKSKSGFYGLQLGVFSDMNTILAIIAELETKYGQTLLVQQEDLNGKTVYKLFMGKYQNRAYADALKSVLEDKYNDSFIVKYE